jgi:hypothetical protein
MHIKLYGKATDSFSMRVRREEESLLNYNNYPPTGHGFSRDGDSIELTIDNDTGTIIGWKPITLDDIKKYKEQD